MPQSFAHSAERTLVRASVKKMDAVWVGQRVPIAVELLTTTTFSGTPVFDFPKLSGALLMKIEDRPVLGTESIDGKSYVTQRHEFALYLQKPGRVIIPPFDVRFSSPLTFGAKPTDYRLKTPKMSVSARMPPGAEQLGTIISTVKLTVAETWRPKPNAKVNVGNALTRTITITVSDVPAMALPRLPLVHPPHVKVYSKPTAIDDAMERGEFTGKRIERVTYVCESEGTVLIPAVVIPWWDVQQRKLKQITLPAVHWEVQSNPLDAPNLESEAVSKERAASIPPWVIWITIAVVLLGIVVWIRRKEIAARIQEWKQTQAESESGRFNTLLRTFQSSDAAKTLNALYHWLDKLASSDRTSSLREMLQRFPSDSLAEQVEQLEIAALHAGESFSGERLVHSLRVLRRRITATRRKRCARLPDLNPRGPADG